jgi:hypothetical protein
MCLDEQEAITGGDDIALLSDTWSNTWVAESVAEMEDLPEADFHEIEGMLTHKPLKFNPARR